MKIIIGLGNPGEKYKNNRHNVGFLAVNYLYEKFGVENGGWQDKFQSGILEIPHSGQKIVLMKPQTFMNDSGKAVREIINFYKLDPSKDIIVLHDEVDLPFGTIRTTKSSSSAGQNGVQNIIDELGSQDFSRIRIGVETRESRAQMDTRDFVLQNFTPEETKKLQDEIFPKVKEEVEKFLESPEK
jgi:PTH1 family peptidyl-tRNA hydrolase